MRSSFSFPYIKREEQGGRRISMIFFFLFVSISYSPAKSKSSREPNAEVSWADAVPPRQCTLALMNAQKLALYRAGSFADRCANKSRHCRCVYANSHPTGEITRFPVGPHSLRNT